MQIQAERMLATSSKKLPRANIGETVMIPLEEVDRGRAEFPNVKGVIIGVCYLFFKLITFYSKDAIGSKSRVVKKTKGYVSRDLKNRN